MRSPKRIFTTGRSASTIEEAGRCRVGIVVCGGFSALVVDGFAMDALVNEELSLPTDGDDAECAFEDIPVAKLWDSRIESVGDVPRSFPAVFGIDISKEEEVIKLADLKLLIATIKFYKFNLQAMGRAFLKMSVHSLRFYPRSTSRVLGHVKNKDITIFPTPAFSKKYEIQQRVRQRMSSESLLLEEYENTSDGVETDIGALVQELDKANIKEDSIAAQLCKLPWTIESVRAFFSEKYPSLFDSIQILDLSGRSSAPVQWIVNVPIPHQRLRVSATEDFYSAFKSPQQLSQLYRHGDPKEDDWILFDLKTIYVNILTPEEMERLDLESLWTSSPSSESGSLESPKMYPSSNDDPNFIPKKLMKFVRRLEYQKMKKKLMSMTRAQKKRLKHFKKKPIVTLSPSSICFTPSHNHNVALSYMKNSSLSKIDKRYALEGQFNEVDAGPDSDTSSLEQHSCESNDDARDEALEKKTTVSITSKRRSRESRRYRRALEKHRMEQEKLTTNE